MVWWWFLAWLPGMEPTEHMSSASFLHWSTRPLQRDIIKSWTHNTLSPTISNLEILGG